LVTLKANERLPVDVLTTSKGALNFQTCPSNSSLVTYVLNDNLFVQDLATKKEYQLTHSVDPVKSGSPSYAVQEEFNRYVGYWWQPTAVDQESSSTYRIVYEEVDDGYVDLTHISPSVENDFGYDTYRYPKAGTPNSKIYLKMIEITFSTDPSVSLFLFEAFV
jgi:dipeptidyl-peptidase 9